MNQIHLKLFQRIFFIPEPEVRRFLLSVLGRLDVVQSELTLVFCSVKYVRALNSRYRNIPAATDVLSFPDGSLTEEEARYLGDIFISPKSPGEMPSNIKKITQ